MQMGTLIARLLAAILFSVTFILCVNDFLRFIWIKLLLRFQFQRISNLTILRKVMTNREHLIFKRCYQHLKILLPNEKQYSICFH